MISADDIFGMCDLDEDEIAAIAEHEHIPEVAAAALGDYLLHREHGSERIRDMIVEDVRAALDRDEPGHAAHLLVALQHFLQQHPEAVA